MQNCRLDAGTNPAAVRAIIEKIDDLCLGYKLPGAGGGGFLYIMGKDEKAGGSPYPENLSTGGGERPCPFCRDEFVGKRVGSEP